MLRLFLGLVVLSLLAAAGAGIWVNLRSLDEPLQVAAPLAFKVPAGSRLARVAADLVGARRARAAARCWCCTHGGRASPRPSRRESTKLQPGMTPRRSARQTRERAGVAAFADHRGRLAGTGPIGRDAPKSGCACHSPRNIGGCHGGCMEKLGMPRANAEGAGSSGNLSLCGRHHGRPKSSARLMRHWRGH